MYPFVQLVAFASREACLVCILLETVVLKVKDI